MKKRMIFFIMSMMLVGLVIAAVITLSAVQQRFLEESRTHLERNMDLVMSSLPAQGSYDGLAKQKAEVLGNDTQITILSQEGGVLGDSQVDNQTAEEHLERKEVREALAGSLGWEVRYSDTLGSDRLYVAKVYENGVIARLSAPFSYKPIFTMDILPSAVFAGIVVLVIGLLLTKPLLKHMLRPFYRLEVLLTKVIDGVALDIPEPVYPELKPVVDRLNDVADHISSYIRSIRRQTDKIDSIVQHMQEGLIMLDGEYRVLLSNDAAKKLLNIDSDLNGQNFLQLMRNREIADGLSRTMQENEPVVLEASMRFDRPDMLRIFISPVWDRDGAILFLSDITEMKRAENVRREFTANVSHELKTPLTTIKGFAELLSENMVGDEQDRKKYAILIRLEAERLIHLINDILRISELEETSIATHPTAVDLYASAREVLELMEEQAQKRGISLRLVGQPLFVEADWDSIKQLILNLVDNAIKYNREQGEVVVSVEEQGGHACLAIEDTGIGIPEQYHDRIFERFYRVDKGRSKKTGGTGLGLSIVKHITQFYGGEIRLSDRAGGGSRFEIWFPLYRSGNEDEEALV
ncbi:MAG: sensor histidine kinase [Christensenellales bacterium]|jgi:two-component system phosphate regulon sensor histidine kinase PhoR